MKYLKILGVLFIVMVLIANFNRDALNDSYSCTIAKDFKRMEYSGIVLKKYIDQKNHRFRTITFKQGASDIVLSKDTSQLYVFVNVGDSIVKKRNDDYLTLFRASKVYTFKIYFGCPN